MQHSEKKWIEKWIDKLTSNLRGGLTLFVSRFDVHMDLKNIIVKYPVGFASIFHFFNENGWLPLFDPFFAITISIKTN